MKLLLSTLVFLLSIQVYGLDLSLPEKDAMEPFFENSKSVGVIYLANSDGVSERVRQRRAAKKLVLKPEPSYEITEKSNVPAILGCSLMVLSAAYSDSSALGVGSTAACGLGLLYSID